LTRGRRDHVAGEISRPRPRDAATVAIVVPLEPDLVQRIEASDPRVAVCFDPELLPPPRFAGDHKGAPEFRRSDAQERRWRAMIERADVLFGIPGDTSEGLAFALHHGRELRWIQATAAGAGEQVGAAKASAADLERVAVTTSSGVHASPLAEFCLLALLAFTKDLPRLLADQRSHTWTQRPVEELRDKTLLIIGLGSIGAEVARLAKALRMRVIGVNRQGTTRCREIDEMHRSDELDQLLARADAIVITLPLTAETQGLIDATAIGRLKPSATIVNVGRGGVIDEDALVEALRQGKLAGAALTSFMTKCQKDAQASCDTAAHEKKLNGAAFTVPSTSCVVTQAIGRGPIVDVSSL